MAPTTRLALTYRRQQSLLSARLMRQVARTWRELVDPGRVDTTWPALRAILAPVVTVARQEATDLARTAYASARTTALVDAEDFMTPPAAALDADRVERMLDITGPVAFKQAIRSGKSPEQAIDAAAVRMAGSAQYLAQEGGRLLMQDSIDTDPRATGWARVTDGSPCAWCAMLASRGPVYKSAQTAGRAQNARFEGDGEFKYHDMCGCQAWPSFTLDEPFVGIADRLYEAWRRETYGYGGRDAVNAFRRWWESEGRAAYTAPTRPGP